MENSRGSETGPSVRALAMGKKVLVFFIEHNLRLERPLGSL